MRALEKVQSQVPPIQVEVRRGAIVESRHEVIAAVVDADGRLVAHAGDPNLLTYWRSAAKPIQALPAISAALTRGIPLADAEIAVMCASHSGEPMHVEAVRALLAKAGATEADLLCGTHPPLHEPSAKALADQDQPPSALHNNCSGKHAGMLLLRRLMGGDTTTYLDPASRVQAHILQAIAEWTGVPASDIPLGIDGCGVPVFGLPLRAMAQAYARLVHDRADSVQRTVQAMQARPELVAGTGRLDTVTMTALRPGVVCKGGAEAVWCLGLTELGWGVALKVLDGASRAVAPAGLEVLGALGFSAVFETSSLVERCRPKLHNHAGTYVGEIRAHLPAAWQVRRG